MTAVAAKYKLAPFLIIFRHLKTVGYILFLKRQADGTPEEHPTIWDSGASCVTEVRVRGCGSSTAPVTGDADPEYEGDCLMQVVPLQHTRLRCVVPVLTLAAAYAVAA